jgi:hypothetical protein
MHLRVYGKGWPWTPLSFTMTHHALQFYAVMAVSRVVCPQGGCPVAVFYPFGHPMPYAYAIMNAPHPTLLPHSKSNLTLPRP